MQARPEYRSGRVLFVVGVAIAIALVTIWLGHTFDPPFSWPSRADALALAGRIVNAAHGAGPIGVAGVIAALALGVLLAVPSSIMVFAVTLIYGLWAIPIVFAGAFLGLSLAFEIARTTLRDDFNAFWHRHIPGTPGVASALDRNGVWLVLCTRLSPLIPFSGQNYMFGTLLTPTRAYLLGSAIGIVPIIFARVFVFNQAVDALEPMPGAIDRALTVVGVLATIAIALMLCGPVRRAMRRRSTARAETARHG